MTPRHRSIVGLILLAAVAAAARHAGAEIIDRVLAVVDGVPITQSDATAVMRLNLAPGPGAAAAGTIPAVRDALVERQLILAEVDRYAPPAPADADVDRAFDAVRTRVGAAQMDATLLQTGGNAAQVRRYLRDTLRMQLYMAQRFGTVQPGEADIADYYRSHAAEFGSRNMSEARDAIIAALTRERRDSLVREWIASLRRRANISILPG